MRQFEDQNLKIIRIPCLEIVSSEEVWNAMPLSMIAAFSQTLSHCNAHAGRSRLPCTINVQKLTILMSLEINGLEWHIASSCRAIFGICLTHPDSFTLAILLFDGLTGVIC